MRLLRFLVLILLVTGNLFAEHLPLKMSQKDVEVSPGKVEKYFVLFPDPPAEVVVKGPAKILFSIRKIIDRKNPLTKLPVVVTISIDGKKEGELTLNDREGSAVIKDAVMYNAGSETTAVYNVKEGESRVGISVSRSAVKGVLLRIERVEEKMAEAPMERSEEKKAVQPITPPLLPLVPPSKVEDPVSAPAPTAAVTKPIEDTEEISERKGPASSTAPSPTPGAELQSKATRDIDVKKKTEEPSLRKEVKTTIPKEGFGEIVILSLKGGVLLPLEYGNPGGYGEFSTYFNLYRGIGVGAFIGSYNINRDYLVNDPATGNFVAKYHLHAVPVMGSLGYRSQMQNILTKFELALGVNMIDLELRRDYAPKKADVINSLAVSVGAEIDYIIRKYGSVGIGIRYLYSNSGNIDRIDGFIKDAKTGGLVLSINYLYGF